MSEAFAESQNQALGGRIHGHVGRPLNDVKAFEMDCHGMSRIGQMPVHESVGGKKITELVVPAGFRNAKNRNQRGARNKNQQSHKQNTEKLFSGQSCKPLLDELERLRFTRFSTGTKKDQSQRGGRNEEFDDFEYCGGEAGVESGHYHRGVGIRTSSVGPSTPCPVSAGLIYL